MTRTARPHPLLSTPRVAGPVLGACLLWGLAQGQGLAQVPTALHVQPGDTASALALPHVPEGATLDQMLLALLRTNPQAFIDGNVNLLRADQTLHLPETAQVMRTSAAQARDTVLEHHNRFREYAQRLAAQAHVLPQDSARELSGKISPPEANRNEQGTGQDRLTLTKDLQDAQALKIPVEKQTQEALAHLAALQKNIEQLQRLAQASEASAAPPASAPAPTLPAWAWIAGLVAAALALLLGLRRRVAASRATPPKAPVVVPAQIAGISLDLDSPSASTGTDRQP